MLELLLVFSLKFTTVKLKGPNKKLKIDKKWAKQLLDQIYITFKILTLPTKLVFPEKSFMDGNAGWMIAHSYQ